jgi:hypothetical protein
LRSFCTAVIICTGFLFFPCLEECLKDGYTMLLTYAIIWDRRTKATRRRTKWFHGSHGYFLIKLPLFPLL